MHGWVESMAVHPEFRWARANGWAFMTEVELLDVLPEDHPQRPQILQLFREHAKGLASYQSGSGFWHQLLDREDSYLETSATAIYAYAFARAINRGWIDAKAYGPAALLAWNAVATKVNAQGTGRGNLRRNRNGVRPGVLLPSADKSFCGTRLRAGAACRGRDDFASKKQKVRDERQFRTGA